MHNIRHMLERAEFIKDRSFEIAWAVFRCAVLIKQVKLKTEVEDAAIDLVARASDFYAEKGENSANKHLAAVEKLEQIVKLAEVANEIKSVNANVLFRELNNLSWAVRHRILEIKEKEEEGVEIEGIFTKQTETEDFNNSANRLPLDNLAPNTKSSVSWRSATGQASEGIKLGNTVKSATKQEGNSADITRQVQIKTRQDGPAGLSHTASLTQNNSANLAVKEMHPLDVADSWQSTILKRIKEFGKASTRELSAYFPQISERTIRFYLQRLHDAGLIERIGKPGPGSYYILSKKSA